MENHPNQRRENAKKTLRIFRVVSGSLLAVFIVLITMLFIFGGTLVPTLNALRLKEAEAVWEQAALSSYDIQIKVTGRQAAVYAVEVRRGEVVSAKHNGNSLPVGPTWSVPGMFATIASDVENFEKVAAGKADATTPRLQLRATFHPQYGYPERYVRIQSDNNTEVTWQVILFKVH